MPFAQPKPQQILKPIDKSLEQSAAQPAPPPETAAPLAVAPQEQAPPPAPETRVVNVQPDSSFFGLSVGVYDPLTHSDKSTAFIAEYQPGIKIAGVLQPIFGGMATTKGSILGYGGLGLPVNLTERVVLMPSVAIGLIKNNGSDFDLDRTVVERVGAELAYRFDDNSRLGLNVHALTNGRSFRAKDRTEVISLMYTMPFNVLSGDGKADAPPVQMLSPSETAAPAPAAASEPAEPAFIPPQPAARTIAPAQEEEKPLPDELP
jgi:lipid A 3-O-deacylase